jgi:hypothetical protein
MVPENRPRIGRESLGVSLPQYQAPGETCLDQRHIDLRVALDIDERDMQLMP